MSKTREKCLAFTLLLLIAGVLHFFFGRAIVSAVLYVIGIGIFWIAGAVIAILFVSALIATLIGSDTLDKAEEWFDKKLGFTKECDCDCEDCDCCEEDEDDEVEYHIEIRRMKKENACKPENQECECEDADSDNDDEEETCDYPYCDECVRECELNEDPDAVEEEEDATSEEASPDDKK